MVASSGSVSETGDAGAEMSTNHTFRPAWRSYWPSAIALLGVYGLWIVQRELFDGIAGALGFPAELSAIGLLIGAAPILAAVLVHHFTRSYELIDGHTVRGTTGFIARQRRQLELSGQVHVDLEQSVAGRLLRYGTLVFWTGDDRSRLQWRNVPVPTQIMDTVDAMRARGDSTVGVPAPGGGAGASAGPSAPSATPEEVAAGMLRAARKAKLTGFGSVPASPTGEPIRYETPFGSYTDHQDGTVTHVESALRMIRAPWGMRWSGERFEGVPIQLTWDEAARLFGRGADVPYHVGGTMARFGEAKRQAAAHAHGYEVGKCSVDFAGRTDWRLATGDELGRMSASLECFMEEDRLRPTDEEVDWAWRGEKNRALVQKLYPELFPGPHLWSATGLGDGLAWGYDGSFPVGDHQMRLEKAVVFVRNETAW